MKKIKILNLDALYQHLKNLSDSLDVHGYDAKHEGINFDGNDSLLGWFMANIHKLKQGCQNILVAEALYSGNYIADGDYITISSKNVGFGILIVIKTVDYGEEIKRFVKKECYLLDIE